MAPHRNGTHEHLLAELQRVFTDALLRGDEHAAELVLREGLDAEVDEAEMDDHVIAPALRAVGDLWQEGELSIGEEHLATEIALRVMALQRELFRVVRRRLDAVVVLAAVEGEQHTVGLRMASNLLAHAGYVVKHLGADVPPDGLLHVVERHEPAVVGLSATMPDRSYALDAALSAVRASRPLTGVVVGGACVADRLLERPGVRACERVSDVVATVDALAQRAETN